ncbi:MAG TPA: DEAD/DEAH box helicase family protein [Acinetobacter parvus]|uniref:type III restriction-modification system endonuclease n=1 Tax=Acinetobacter parvus TaxID=134533 RepID=UPI002CB906B1|nr:DEAD/DEAH box helicase family protein [Acinetobacter parvus]HRM15981.1 DEAD/DEAH box helicase family protein [Acinetobacter parvus]
MEIRFKTLGYQKDSVQAIVDCFKGQPRSEGHRYMIDQGAAKAKKVTAQVDMLEETLDLQGGKAKKVIADVGFENAHIFDLQAVLKNIQDVQASSGLQRSSQLITDDNGKGKNLTKSPLNLDIEMETGTGKTYCYIRSMFELHKQYGWSKFIVVVPSIAIREGVYKSLNMMADHFQEQYGKKARFFIYDSKALHHLESFSSNGGINVMVINVQAFNATGKDNRRIYDELDEFQSRRPIDVISRNRPILILDEPQKMGADKTLESLSNFNPLFILRYSATHKRNYNLVYRLDALDAYNQKLVKKITVKGVEVQGLSGTHGYLYLQDILVSKSAPVARLELEIAEKNGFRRLIRQIKKGDNLYNISGQAEQYHDRYVVIDIDARDNSVTFENGKKIHVGEAVGHVDEQVMRTIQIRETIRSHLQKERQLYNQGIKVLSLFFIDEVAKYRQYDEDNNPIDGEYVQIFKEQYQQVLNEIEDLNLENDPYFDYLKAIEVDRTHNGYFSIDKKSKRLANPAIDKKAEEAQVSNDTDAYDLILKDKERLLSFEEPTRFIFSHSALREGWDNPNVFVICTLKHSDNVISRHQEVGRGMRLAVNKFGERMDANHFQGALGEIHKLNNLTVVTNESYKEFVSNLQSEILNTIQNRPTQATPDYFKGKIFKLSDGSSVEVTELMAKQINKHLSKHDYIDDNDQLTPKYHEAKEQGTLAELPENLVAYTEQIHKLIDGLFDPKALEGMADNGNKKLTNNINQTNLERKEFQALWSRINRKAVYQIHLDSEKLIEQSISAVERTAKERNNKFVETLSYKLAEATQNDESTYEQVKAKEMFGKVTSKTEVANISIQSQVTYDLIGNIADDTNLTRKTVARILQGINAAVFAQFKLNPEAFIREMSRIINEQQAKMVIQGLKYNPLDSTYPDNEIFVSNENIPLQAYKAERHVWDYVVTDSDVERKFVEVLDGADEVVVYAKLPDRFQIPTPFGSYNPDWAIAFNKDKVRQIYFVAETKGSMLDADLKAREKSKIESAKKFFATLNQENQSLGDEVQYSVIDSFGSLMNLVK